MAKVVSSSSGPSVRPSWLSTAWRTSTVLAALHPVQADEHAGRRAAVHGVEHVRGEFSHGGVAEKEVAGQAKVYTV